LARFILLVILIFAAARFVWRLFDTVLRAAGGPAPPGSSRGGRAPTPVKMQPCPVCGTYVVPGKAISVVAGGAPMYFCSDKCRADYQSR
jgi:YHS domain-containing protein